MTVSMASDMDFFKGSSQTYIFVAYPEENWTRYPSI